MLTTDERNLILYRSQLWFVDTAVELQLKTNYSNPCDAEYAKAFKVLNYLAVLQDTGVDLALTEDQQDVIYTCLQTSLLLQNYPVAGMPFSLVDTTTFVTGIQGPPGQMGAPGADGTDADIDVLPHPDGNITVVTTYPGGVKTATIQYTPYVSCGITVSIDDGVVIAPDQSRVMQLGLVIPSLQVFSNLVKGRQPVTASTLLTPGGLNTAYQLAINIALLNSAGTQNAVVLDTNVAATTSYLINITDGTSTPSSTATLTFVYPFLYGATVAGGAPGTGTTMYAALSKLVKTKSNHTVTFNNTNKFFWFAYPLPYGALLASPNVGIRDQNGFDLTSAFTKFDGGGAGISTTSQGLTNNWTTNYIFYRTNAATDIVGPYTFYFS